MSLDDRIRRGLHQAIEPLTARDETVEAALVQTKTVTVPRQKRRVVALAATAVALVVALGVSQNIGRLLLSVERRLPPAEEDQKDERTEESEEIERGIDKHGVVEEDSSGSTTASRRAEGKKVEASAEEDEAGDTLPVPASADGGEDRPPVVRQEKAYEYREGYSDAAGCWASGQTCDYAAEFRAAKAFRFVSIEVRDSSGRDVVANVYLDRDGDGEVESEGTQICTSTAAPLRIAPGSSVRVVMAGAGCDTPAYARGPTSGSVVATFRTSS